MKIINNDKTETTFSDIECGQCFVDKYDTVYMKVDGEKLDKAYKDTIAVRMHDGVAILKFDETKVRRLNTKLVIEGE